MAIRDEVRPAVQPPAVVLTKKGAFDVTEMLRGAARGGLLNLFGAVVAGAAGPR
jgi:hypothetical protein